MDGERLRAWAPWATFGALSVAAWLVARFAGHLGDPPAGWLLLPAALLALGLCVRRLPGADLRDDWPWLVAALAALHLVWYASALLAWQDGCPSGPLPWQVRYAYLRYLGATRVVPLLLLGLAGAGLLAVPRWRTAGGWTLSTVAIQVLIHQELSYGGPGCGLPE